MSELKQLSLLDRLEEPYEALLTPNEIFKLLDADMLRRLAEDRRIEWKPASFQGHPLGEYISMWANTAPEGGIIVIGVSDDGRLEGLRAKGDPYINKMEKNPRTFCPDAIVETSRIPVTNTKDNCDFVLAFRVQYHKSRVVKTNKGRAYTRRGDSKYEVHGAELLELQADKDELSFEAEPSRLSYPDEFDLKAIRSFTENVAGIRDMEEGHTREDILSLMHLGDSTTGEFQPNIACTLLFAKDSRKEIPGCRVRFLRFDGDEEGTGGKWNAVKDEVIDGQVPQMIVETDTLIESQIRTFSRLDSNERFTPQPEYPKTAWHEAIVNACVHRSYGNGLKTTNIFVKMFDNRLVIESPGGFPPFVTPENIYDTHRPRNPYLMEAMRHLDFVKCAHEGTRRMRAVMSKMSLPDPEFQEKESGSFRVRVTLRNNVHQRKAWVDVDVTEVIGTLLAQQLDENEKRFVNFIAEHGELNVTEAGRLSRLSWATAKKILMKLVERGILRHDRRRDIDRDPHARFRLNKPE